MSHCDQEADEQSRRSYPSTKAMYVAPVILSLKANPAYASYGSGKDVRGNNGVGNGVDPAPPGNPPVNDGAGTEPGNPGQRR